MIVVALVFVPFSALIALAVAGLLPVVWFAFAVVTYLIGCAATAALTATLGERNPNTIGDSFLGDDTLDATVIAWWPLTVLMIAAWSLARHLADRLPPPRRKRS